MKKTIFLLLFFSGSIFSAEDQICKTSAGEMLSFSVVDSVFVGEEAKPFNEIKKALNDEFLVLCKSGKNSSDIISEMYNRCFKLTHEKVKNKESKAHFEKTCHIAYTAATYYMEGYEEGQREYNEKICDDKNPQKEIEREIPAGIPETKSALKK